MKGGRGGKVRWISLVREESEAKNYGNLRLKVWGLSTYAHISADYSIEVSSSPSLSWKRGGYIHKLLLEMKTLFWWMLFTYNGRSEKKTVSNPRATTTFCGIRFFGGSILSIFGDQNDAFTVSKLVKKGNCRREICESICSFISPSTSRQTFLPRFPPPPRVGFPPKFSYFLPCRRRSREGISSWKEKDK